VKPYGKTETISFDCFSHFIDFGGVDEEAEYPRGVGDTADLLLEFIDYPEQDRPSDDKPDE
jgi:hypothetical protein